MKRGLLSIIIPVYNGAATFRILLDQFKPQINGSVEIVVVDDGSTEDVTWVKDYPNVVYIRKENGGCPTARNVGLEKARGEYITLVDADDEIPPDYVSIVLENMCDGYDWVSYDWICDNGSGKVTQTDEPLLINLATWGYSFRRDFIGDIRFNEKMNCADDTEWLRRVLRDDCKHKHDHRIIYNYQWERNPDSLSHRCVRGELKVWKDEA